MDKASGREWHRDLQGGFSMMYLGIDISKAKLDCTLLDPATDKRKTKAVVNPAQVRDFARGLAMRTKTDGTDSVALARYGALIQPDPWEAPPPEIRELKALITRLEALETDARRELNRREKALVAQAPALVRAALDE